MSNNLKFNFLKKRLLGQRTNINNSVEVIKKCISLAYQDMMDVGIYYLDTNLPKMDKQKTINNNIRKDNFYNILVNNNFVFSIALIEEVTNIFGPSERITNSKNNYVTRFGLAQKLVNMTFKYLYIFSDEIDQTINFSNCDCPLDSIIIETLNLNETYTWSKLTKEEYLFLQTFINNVVEDKDKYNELGRLLYDFKYW